MSLRALVVCATADVNTRDLLTTLARHTDIEVSVLTDSVNYDAVPGVPHDRIYHYVPSYPADLALSVLCPGVESTPEAVFDDVAPDITLVLGTTNLRFVPQSLDASPIVFLPQGHETDRAFGETWGRFGPLFTPIYRRLFQQLMSSVDEVWTQAHARNAYEQLGLPPERFVAFDWGPIDVETFTPDVEPVAYTDDPGTLVVGTLRRLQQIEMLKPSYDTLLDGVARLVDRGADVHAVVGGYNFHENALEAYIDWKVRRLGLDAHVTRMDSVPKSDVQHYYAGLDVYVNPTYAGTRVGGIGTGSKEAMACGCAFLTMNDPPMDYLIDHQENGLLVDHGDDAALANELARLCDDPSALATLARNARETVVDRFSRAAVGERMSERCHELVQRE